MALRFPVRTASCAEFERAGRDVAARAERLGPGVPAANKWLPVVVHRGGYPNRWQHSTVAYSGPTPIPSNLTAQATTWLLTDSNDTVFKLQTFPDAVNSGAYDIARPIQITWRDGKSWQLNYGAAGELDSVDDLFGNSLAFTWAYGYSGAANVPQAIQTVTLPSQHSIQYTYATVGGPVGGASAPELLTQVQYLDANGVEDLTSYDCCAGRAL